MSTPKHTPAPWLSSDHSVYALEPDKFHKGEMIFRNRFYLSVQANGRVPRNEVLANATLIAHAPELLEKLKEIATWLETRNDKEGFDFESVRKLISEASQSALI